ncbi:MAG TPA: ABC transporter permease subunit, partial [Sphingobacteriaceae bacterium]|nr:ABC transporter permease subunit [Sphingobacteriaceae bacterium]
MFSIFKREIKAYFNSWSGYLVIGLFLLLNGLVNWVFKDTSILDRGYASMDVFFEFSPYLLVLLISVITMRSLAGEKSEGTLEWLQTRPIHTIDLILGKFFGGLAIFILALLPTLVYVYSIYALALPTGNVDLGSIIGSYIGLILFAGAFVAIGLFASAISNQVIPAFLLSIVLGFCF